MSRFYSVNSCSNRTGSQLSAWYVFSTGGYFFYISPQFNKCTLPGTIRLLVEIISACYDVPVCIISVHKLIQREILYYPSLIIPLHLLKAAVFPCYCDSTKPTSCIFPIQLHYIVIIAIHSYGNKTVFRKRTILYDRGEQ